MSVEMRRRTSEVSPGSHQSKPSVRGCNRMWGHSDIGGHSLTCFVRILPNPPRARLRLQSMKQPSALHRNAGN